MATNSKDAPRTGSGNGNKVKDLVGKQVRLTKPCWAGQDKILPRGLILNAVAFGRAMDLQTPECPACGVAVRLTDVRKQYFEPYDPKTSKGAAYPARAVWADSDDPEASDAVHCTKCGFISSMGEGYKTHAVGPDGNALHWRFCPGCGAGMALPTDIDPKDIATAEEYPI